MAHIVTVHTEAPSETVAEREYAGFWRRAAALGMDFGLVLILQYGVSWFTGNQGRLDGNIHPRAFFIWATVVAWLYFAGFEASRRHATPGKQAVGLRVVDTDGSAPSFVRTTVRFLVKFALSIPLFGVGCLAMLRDGEARTWHDVVAGTQVVVD